MDINKFSLKERPKSIRSAIGLVAVFSAALICVLYLINDLNLDDSNMSFEDRFSFLSEDFHITTDTLDEDTSLPIRVSAQEGESIYISTTLPEISSSSTALVIRNYHQRLKAYIDGEEIYEFPSHEQNLTDSIITDTWNRIYLPIDATGKTITIELHPGLSGFEGNLEPYIIGEDNSIMAYLQAEYAIPYALGVLAVIFGVLLIAVSTIYANNRVEKSHLILGFVFISIGFWFIDRSLTPVLMVGSNMKFFAAFSLFTLAPLLISLYVAERFSNHDQTIPNLLIYGNIVFMIVLFAMVGLRILPLHGEIPLVYAAILIPCIYMAYLTFYYSYGKGRVRLNQVQLYSVKLEFLSLVLAAIGSVASLIWDNVSASVNGTSQDSWSYVGRIQMISVIVFAAFHFIILVYNSYYSALESEATQKKLHDSQLQLMMGQIQPHFMFNTLSSIRTLIKIDPDMAYDMTYNFSNYLRANVDNLTNMDGISFSEEVEHIKNYINIEMVRFGDRLNVELDIQEDEFIVPPLSIQPLVENAIKHGVCQKPEGGTVWLRSFEEGRNYIVEVEDNGIGIPEDRLEIIRAGAEGGSILFDDVSFTGNGSEQHQSTGMKNITLRLKEISGATLDATSEEGKGTLMRVIFPKDAQPKEEERIMKSGTNS